MDNPYIMDGDFVRIITDKFVVEGVKKGRLAYVAGHRALPIDEDDPYTQRIKFIVALCDGNHVNPGAHYLMDALSLKKVSAKKQEALTNIMRLDFEPQPDAAPN